MGPDSCPQGRGVLCCGRGGDSTLPAAQCRAEKKGCEVRERQIGEQHEKESQKQAEPSSDGIRCRRDGRLALSGADAGVPPNAAFGHPAPPAARGPRTTEVRVSGQPFLCVEVCSAGSWVQLFTEPTSSSADATNTLESFGQNRTEV